jgi:hypothetical protein
VQGAFYVKIGSIASAFSCIVKAGLRTDPDMEAGESIIHYEDMGNTTIIALSVAGDLM